MLKKRKKRKKNSEPKKKCPYCEKEFLEKNFEKHVLNQHARVHLHANSNAKRYIIENGVVKFITD